jgi:hypothetical protein
MTKGISVSPRNIHGFFLGLPRRVCVRPAPTRNRFATVTPTRMARDFNSFFSAGVTRTRTISVAFSGVLAIKEIIPYFS